MTGHENRRADDPRIQQLADALKDNTEKTEEVRRNTADIVEAWTAISGFLAVLVKIAKFAKYVSYFAIAISTGAAALYALEQLNK